MRLRLESAWLCGEAEQNLLSTPRFPRSLDQPLLNGQRGIIACDAPATISHGDGEESTIVQRRGRRREVGRLVRTSMVVPSFVH